MRLEDREEQRERYMTFSEDSLVTGECVFQGFFPVGALPRIENPKPEPQYVKLLQ